MTLRRADEINPYLTHFEYGDKSYYMKAIDFCNSGVYPLFGKKVVLIEGYNWLKDKHFMKDDGYRIERYQTTPFSKFFLGLISFVAFPIVSVTLLAKWMSSENYRVYSDVYHYMPPPAPKPVVEQPPQRPLLTRVASALYKKIGPSNYRKVYNGILNGGMFLANAAFRYSAAALAGQSVGMDGGELLSQAEEFSKAERFSAATPETPDSGKLVTKVAKLVFRFFIPGS